MLSSVPSQSLSCPGFSQVSVTGVTAPRHSPNAPSVHVRVPSVHSPIPENGNEQVTVNDDEVSASLSSVKPSQSLSCKSQTSADGVPSCI